ncbi:MAG: GNAT family N-acetyltransferase [Defluviitaleaceae bacterium]|nr:GNAT family N-acetyltransferase [Defluviitaleaceae bacterium]MCL2264060.1 GNAT family N-acetyltransferase [Defluviitaleaceae bacterium]
MEIRALTGDDILWTKLADYANACSWKAGAELSEKMKNHHFSGWERVFVALSGNEIVGYCTLSKTDCIPNLPYTPYIGFIFVCETFRGNRISEKLCACAAEYAKSIGFQNVYLISDHVNLYEKYGFTKINEQLAPWGAMETIFTRPTEPKKPEMTAQDAVELIRLFEQNGIEICVDGGWGVDALLGTQTRKHDDLDIALPHKFVPKLREILESRGFKDIPRDDTRECNFVLGDSRGRLVDIHSYTFDENGKHIFGVAYEPHQLTGRGTIEGYPVKCIPPATAVEFHTGYAIDENDYRDVKALCERFGIPLPKDYTKFEKPQG